MRALRPVVLLPLAALLAAAIVAVVMHAGPEPSHGARHPLDADGSNAGSPVRPRVRATTEEGQPQSIDLDVRSLGGGPLGEARIELLCGETTASQTLTGADGRARVQRPSGADRCRVSKRGHAPLELSLAADSDVIRVVLVPAITLSGRVLDLDTGEPIPDALIRSYVTSLGGDTQRPSESVRTKGDGTFLLENAPAYPNFGAVVSAAGHLPARVSLPADVPEEVRIWMEPAGTIHGVIADTAGHPVPGAGVTATACSGPDADTRVESPTAEANAVGEFELRGVQLGTTHVVHARGPMGTVAQAGPVTVSATQRAARCDMVLLAPCKIVVSMTDTPETATRTQFAVHGASSRLPANTGELSSPATVEALAAGPYLVHWMDSGSATVSRRIEVVAGQSVVAVPPPHDDAATPRVEVCVVDDVGVSVPRATISISESLECGCNREWEADTDEVGKVIVQGLTPARHTLHATIDGLSQDSVTWGAKSVEIRLVRPCRVGFSLQTPLDAGASVLWTGLGEGGAALDGGRLTRDAGESHCEVLLAPSVVSLKVQPVGYPPQERRVVATPGGRVNAGEFSFGPRMPVAISCAEPGGSRVRPTRVQALTTDDLALICGELPDELGVCTMKLVPNSPVVLRVEAIGFPEQHFPLTPPPADGSLSLRLQRGGFVYVRVRGSDGRPGCTSLSVVSRDAGLEAGLLEFAPGSYGGRLLPGGWEFEAARGGERSPRTVVTVAEGTTSEVLLDMSR